MDEMAKGDSSTDGFLSGMEDPMEIEREDESMESQPDEQSALPSVLSRSARGIGRKKRNSGAGEAAGLRAEHKRNADAHAKMLKEKKKKEEESERAAERRKCEQRALADEVDGLSAVLRAGW